eukprot:jgi/Mesen1/2449/ME000158S01641
MVMEPGDRLLLSWTLFQRISRYTRPPSLVPFVVANVAGFYTGLVLAAITEQLYKEKYWEDHPGEAVPVMRPWLYYGKYHIRREDFADGESK